MSLKNHNALITGAGTGIGRAIALALAEAGAHVALTGRRLRLLEESAALIRSRCAAAAPPQVRVLDVTDRAAVDAVTAELTRAMGPLDVLVNNAGVGGPNACSSDGPDRWDEVVRTNLDGVFFASRAALRSFRDGGRVLNIASVLGKFGVPGYTAYCASKHGVIGFTKALALELAPRRITVNALCPGWTETEMAVQGMQGIAASTGTTYEQARASALALVPMGRIVQPEEVGQLALYLCSPQAAMVTGQAWSICGGSTMG